MQQANADKVEERWQSMVLQLNRIGKEVVTVMGDTHIIERKITVVMMSVNLFLHIVVHLIREKNCHWY